MAEFSALVRLSVNTGTSGSPTWKKIQDETELTLSFNKDTIEISSKDTIDDKAYMAGLKSGTVSCSAIVKYTPSSGFVSAEDMWTYLNEGPSSANKGLRQYKIADATVGSSTYTFDAIMTSLEQPSPLADALKFTFQLQISGAVTQTPVTS